ncbi:MAG: hypothetical protein K1060chlam2_00042 [Chlamydiae bacterium]|nr:hypothetical protein [Chlamydiota bacterium]
MIAKYTSLTSIYKSVSVLNRIVLAASLIVSCAFLLEFFKPAKPVLIKAEERTKEQKTLSTIDYRAIGEGSLALSSNIQRFPFPNLTKEILFLGRNSRPDATLYSVKLQMGIRGSDRALMVAPGQKLYLSYVDRQLTFAEDTTPLWIKPYLNESGEVWLEMGLRLLSESGELLLDEAHSFEIESTLKSDPSGAIKSAALSEAFEGMKRAKWWAPDRLFEIYGGEAYGELAHKQRLEFEGGHFLHVEEGETFIWNEGRWQRSAATEGYPMARLSALSPYRMEWELWDRTGLEWVKAALVKEKNAAIGLRVATAFTRMRQRTHSRISCRIDNKAAILKRGDWLLHTATGWSILKSLKDVEAVLAFKMRGELFVFDGLERVEGRAVFCGMLFDSMRTQMRSVTLPLVSSKKSEQSPPQKKPISTKIRRAGGGKEAIRIEKSREVRTRTIRDAR